MKKIIMFSLIFCLIFISGCTKKVYFEDIKLYYPTSELDLEVKDVNLSSTNKQSLIEEVRDMLTKIEDEDVMNYYNSDIYLSSVELNEDTLIVHLDGVYTKFSLGERTLIKSGIIKSYSNFDFISNIKFYLNGSEMEDEYGKKIDNIRISDIITLDDDSIASNIIICNLYYVINDKLDIEERTFENQSTVYLAKNIVEELIKGPTNKDYTNPIPKETKVKQLEIKDGICYLDFNKEFVSRHPGGELNETLTIYSIVNTLTELNEINSVQFLIDGEKVDEYKGNYDFSMPFNRNESILVVEG